MPIYAYRCVSCGFENDHLQKLSDPLLRICPHCGQSSYRKQVTAAGFQLKGNGWYATDFKDGKSRTPPAKEPLAEESASPAKPESTQKTPASAGAAGVGVCADS